MTRITANYNGKQFHGMRGAFVTDRNYDCPITGTIYGCLLNEVNALKANAPRFTEKPYIAPPLAPILYIKPENTKAGHGAEVTLPPSASHVHVGATLGLSLAKQLLLSESRMRFITFLAIPLSAIFPYLTILFFALPLNTAHLMDLIQLGLGSSTKMQSATQIT